jgi:hypothetical protein
MLAVSSTIGKDQPPSVQPGVASRQQAEQQANAVERDERATRFRASLTRPDTVAGERAAALKNRDGAPTARTPGKAGGQPEAAGRSSGDKGEKADRDSGLDRTLSLGLTGEQALALEAALGGASGTERKRGGPGGGEPGMDDLSLGASGGLDRAGSKLGHTPGEEALVEVAAAVSAAAAPVHGQSWARPEGPQAQRPSARELPQPLPGVDPVHQLFIGRGPAGAEARMMITVGPLAGTEIQLREGPGGVQASIITQNASARQTLSSAMSAVAERLKAKGQKLDVKFDSRGGNQPGDSGRFAEQRQGK